MKRRELLTLLGSAAAWPLVARAQQPARMQRLGFLSLGLPNDAFSRANIAAFLQGLAALGWKEGFNLLIDWRWYAADAAAAGRQAAELITLKPDVLFAAGNPAV